MELVSRFRFTEMLQTLVDVTTVKHTHIDLTEPICFTGYATQYIKNNRLLAEELHTIDGSIYYIDTKWEEEHIKEYMKPNQISMGWDDRGWHFDMFNLSESDYPESEQIRILAGCRNRCRNLSLEKAKEHWKENPEVYPRVLMAEAIAKHRGWLDMEPQVDAGELAGEKTPTVAILPEDDEPLTHEEIRHREKLINEYANTER